MLIIHRTDLASYGWEVVRNSQAVEKSYLEGDPTATLRAAAWIQHDVAQRLFTLAGLGSKAREYNGKILSDVTARVSSIVAGAKAKAKATAPVAAATVPSDEIPF